MAVASIYQIIYGLKQRKEYQKEKAALGDRDYLSARDINQQAKGAAQGYTAAERANFFQNLVRQNNAAYSRAMSYRPDMAGTILAGINYGNIGSLNRFAANDASLRRQDQQRQASLIAQQDARQMQNFYRKADAVAELGQAAQKNIVGGIQNEESDIKDVFSMIYGGGMQGSGGQRKDLGTTNTNYSGAPVANQPAYQANYTDYGSSFRNGSQSTYAVQPYQGGQPYYGAPSNAAPSYYNGYNNYYANPY